MPKPDQFFIGWAPKAPRALIAFNRKVVAGVAIGLVCLAISLGLAQQPMDPGAFEFGVIREFEGVLYETPLPLLHLPASAAGGKPCDLLLVAAGKFGLPAFARGHHGQKVRAAGSLIYRHGQLMLELNTPRRFKVLSAPAPADLLSADSVLGAATLTGELVDTKCYLGVMRPATGKVHRACAIRCLSGGIPPGLLVRDRDGNGFVVLLTGKNGDPPQFNVEWAGLPVTARGRLELRNNVPVLFADHLELEASGHE